MTWLHWIGRGYYKSPTVFKREAVKLGITRRVDLRTMAQMAWGDVVWLVMMDGKSGVRIGGYRIQQLAGVSPEAMDKLRALGLVGDVLNLGGRNVERGCGIFEEGISLQSRAPLAVLAQALQEMKTAGMEIGKPMVGGSWDSLLPVRFKDIPQRQGFRSVDWAAVEAARTVAVCADPTGTRTPTVRGQFYGDKIDPGTPEVPEMARVTVVIDYEKAKARMLRKRSKSPVEVT